MYFFLFFFLFNNNSEYLFFFFSSRSRHTSCSRDWSSDVCSSDLCRPLGWTARLGIRRLRGRIDRHRQCDRHALVANDALDFALDVMGELTRTELRKIDTVAR